MIANHYPSKKGEMIGKKKVGVKTVLSKKPITKMVMKDLYKK